MIQKWARAGVKTNAIGAQNFAPLQLPFNINKHDNLQPHELTKAKQVYIVGTNLAQDHPVISHLIQNMRFEKHTPVTYITQESNCLFSRRVDNIIHVKDYHAFIRAINYFLLKSKKAFGIFLEGLALNFSAYKAALLQENYKQLLEKSGVEANTVEKIAQEWIDIPESVIIVSEKTIDCTTFCELKNSMYLTEKQGKMFSGMMTLKTACNSQGLFDMGIHPKYGPGFRKIEGDYLELLKKVWKTNDLPTNYERKEAKNLFIFGENGENNEMAELVKSASFVCIQSLFENDATSVAADLVLPMNFAIEIGGSFTSSFKVVQSFNAVKTCEFGWNDYQFYAQLQKAFGVKSLTTPDAIFLEMIALLQPGCCSETRHKFE
jgi:predicted molibdopterin-dependent oxidoreductase YjgC